METMEVKTTLHCKGCVDKVRPVLDAEESINNWEADINGEVTLKVDGKISKDHLNQLLGQKGYAIKEEQSFWGDWNKWKRASTNTFSCLIGCSIGDFGMVFFLQAYYPSTPLMWQMVLAIIAGLCTSIILETILMKTKESFGWLDAFKTALGMSFLSMVAMEIAMTSTDFMITGGKAAFNDIWYWLALIPALIVGFLVPLPYNYYKLKKFNQACH